MVESLVKLLKRIKVPELPDIHDLQTKLERGLWVLYASKKAGSGPLTAKEISDLLVDFFGISISNHRSIATAFTGSYAGKGAKKIHIISERGSTSRYKIMRAGEDYLRSLVVSKSNEILYIEAGKKFSTKIKLIKDIFSELRGEIKVVDPYIDVTTLDLLSNISGTSQVRVLAQKNNNISRTKQEAINKSIKDFTSEHSHFEVKVANSGLHDRYIISENNIVLIGHSLKDLGGKESFVIVLDKAIYKDLSNTISSKFMEKWGNASVV